MGIRPLWCLRVIKTWILSSSKHVKGLKEHQLWAGTALLEDENTGLNMLLTVSLITLGTWRKIQVSKMHITIQDYFDYIVFSSSQWRNVLILKTHHLNVCEDISLNLPFAWICEIGWIYLCISMTLYLCCLCKIISSQAARFGAIPP